MQPVTAVVLIAIVASACSGEGSNPTSQGSVLDGVPDVARAATGVADQRPSASWVSWSSCGDDSQAATAAANGGRAAGWILVDDLLDDPGIALGDYVVPTCPEAVDLLERADDALTTEDPANALAGQLLTAELNLNVGAETCPAAEEVVVAGHVVLSEVDFRGPGIRRDDPVLASDGPARITELLAAYNRGELCR